jgi:hypothetical protein
MTNTGYSARGTSWDIIVTHPGFRAGFSDVREGRDWEPLKAKHGRDWWWWYEDGRLFAASEYSRRWAQMPSDRKKVTPMLRKAVVAAGKGGTFPRVDGDWGRP